MESCGFTQHDDQEVAPCLGRKFFLHDFFACVKAMLLEGSGVKTATNANRGFGHGTFVPLTVITGAAGPDRATVAYNGTILDLRLSAYHFG
jgi:hypothetical protein